MNKPSDHQVHEGAGLGPGSPLPAHRTAPPLARVRVWLAVFVVAQVLVTGGCPRRRRPVVPEVPTSGNPEARLRFHSARDRFESDSQVTASEFAAIARQFPDDPVAPYALLWAGMAAWSHGEHGEAVAVLERLETVPDLAPGLLQRARLYRGFALVYAGRYGEALAVLGDGRAAIESDAEQGEWVAAMAEATRHSPRPLAALPYYDQWYGSARASERKYIAAQLSELVAAAPREDVERLYQSQGEHRLPSAAIVGERVAAEAAQAGDLARARAIREETAAARRLLGLAVAPRRVEQGDPGRLGAILPLSGRRARIGDAALRGLAMAAQSLRSRSAWRAHNLELSLRDSGSTAAGALVGAKALAEEGAIAVVGPVDGHSVESAARHAGQAGVPLISLDPRGEGAALSPYVFHVLHSAEDRARSLARYAVGRGVRTFAMLAPKNGYGRAVGDAFRDEVRRIGATLVAAAVYDANETSFTEVVARINKPWQALFIPDRAARLELIAPALAAANLMARPLEEGEPSFGRRFFFLSTAEALSPAYLTRAARYSWGAVFAPGFYPDRADPIIERFVTLYEEHFAREPGSLEAFSYDAALAIRTVLEGGARTREEVVIGLAGSRVEGVTGTVAFGTDRRRSDASLLFAVQRDEMGDFVIRALRN